MSQRGEEVADASRRSAGELAIDKTRPRIAARFLLLCVFGVVRALLLRPGCRPGAVP